MTHDPRCPRCGAPLKVEVVRKLFHVLGVRPIDSSNLFDPNEKVEYREVEEVADCVRCTGAY